MLINLFYYKKLKVLNEYKQLTNKKILVNISDQEFREGLIKDHPLIQ